MFDNSVKGCIIAYLMVLFIMSSVLLTPFAIYPSIRILLIAITSLMLMLIFIIRRINHLSKITNDPFNRKDKLFHSYSMIAHLLGISTVDYELNDSLIERVEEEVKRICVRN